MYGGSGSGQNLSDFNNAKSLVQKSSKKVLLGRTPATSSSRLLGESSKGNTVARQTNDPKRHTYSQPTAKMTIPKVTAKVSGKSGKSSKVSFEGAQITTNDNFASLKSGGDDVDLGNSFVKEKDLDKADKKDFSWLLLVVGLVLLLIGKRKKN